MAKPEDTRELDLIDISSDTHDILAHARSFADRHRLDDIFVVAFGRIEVQLTPGGQRTVRQEDVSRLAAERRRKGAERPIVAQSARNRFAGTVTRVERDGVAAVVEVQAGPHRLVSLMTREASEELALGPGDEVVCVVKATDVIVELPSS